MVFDMFDINVSEIEIKLNQTYIFNKRSKCSIWVWKGVVHILEAI